MSGGASILVVDDERDAAELLWSTLSAWGYAPAVALDAETARTNLEESSADLVLVDLDLGEESGLDLCAHVVGHHADVPVIIVTGQASLKTAIGALRAGAFDFLTKPVDLEQLRHRVDHALTHRELVTEVKRLRRVSQIPQSADIIGESGAIQKLLEMIARLGDSDVTTLVTGESGVGKELVARALHEQGTCADGPFVAVNCAAVPRELMESELFGHVRGAFTDARRNRDGLFVRASKGTLFLDEIAELPLEIQAKLLRALQERRVRPVGGDREVPFDTRIVSATNQDLEAAVEEGRFREDLYYRVNVVRLHVPPLRARGTDILLLAQHFMRINAERADKPIDNIAVAAADKLLAYDWPGNVRELENAMERAVALAQSSEIQVEDLPPKVRAYEPSTLVVAGSDPSELLSLDELEARYIRRVLEVVKGNKTRAAEILGVGRRTLYRRLEQIDADDGS